MQRSEHNSVTAIEEIITQNTIEGNSDLLSKKVFVKAKHVLPDLYEKENVLDKVSIM
jgi:hypothetical protein